MLIISEAHYPHISTEFGNEASLQYTILPASGWNLNKQSFFNICRSTRLGIDVLDHY